MFVKQLVKHQILYAGSIAMFNFIALGGENIKNYIEGKEKSYWIGKFFVNLSIGFWPTFLLLLIPFGVVLIVGKIKGSPHGKAFYIISSFSLASIFFFITFYFAQPISFLKDTLPEIIIFSIAATAAGWLYSVLDNSPSFNRFFSSGRNEKGAQ